MVLHNHRNRRIIQRMGIHYDCGNGWSRTSFARRTQDVPVYLCCPGPSLPRGITTGPGYTVAALNTAYPRVRPDMWFGMDDPGCYDQALWSESFAKFCRGNYGDRRDMTGRLIKKSPMTFFLDVEKAEMPDIFQRRAHDIKFVWQHHTLGVALHALVWMGYRDIRLVGCDLGGSQDYWHGSLLNPEEHERNQRLYRMQEHWLRLFRSMAAARGIRLSSCTPNSPINKFLDFTSFDQSLPVPARTKPIPAGRLDGPVTVACVLRSGGDFTVEYVERLRLSLLRHMHNHRFVCLSDVPMPKGIERIPLTHAWPGWWSKIELFKHLTEGRTIYFDLDTVIKGDVNCLKRFKQFTMLGDFLHPEVQASGVMAWDGSYQHIYDMFRSDYTAHMKAYQAGKGFDTWGDQAFIRNFVGDEIDTWQDICPHTFASYKLSTEADIADASVICYHGKPRPHETGWAASPAQTKAAA